MKVSILGLIFGLLAFTPVVFAQGPDLTVRPFLIDETIEPREYIKKDISLTNNKPHKITVYATVNEITVDSEGEIKQFVSPIMTDRTNTITSWVEIGRGRIEIQPGETVTVPLGFRTHPYAEAGEYHVFIGFGVTNKRYLAEQAAMNGELEGVIAKITIDEKANEYLRIGKFIIDRFVSSDDDRKVEVELENQGDIAATPVGEIIFFDSRGQELQAIPFNTEGISIPPKESATIITEIPLDNELGRFKANLSLRYGAKQTASLYDSTQFFMVPIHIILVMLLFAILIGLLIFFLLYRALAVSNDDYDGETHDLPFYVRDGHDANPQEHDIDLSKKE